jgi:hypothetical protein
MRLSAPGKIREIKEYRRMIRLESKKVSVRVNRKERYPIRSGKESVKSGLDVVIIFLSIVPSKNISIETQILQTTRV